MRIENNRLKLLTIVLILFLCTSLIIINATLAIYRSRLSTVINLTVLDPESNLIVTFDENYDGGTTWNVTKEYEDELGSDYTIPSRTGYNFLGWFTDPTDGTEIGVSTIITANVTYYAHWEKIVCMKAKPGTLHTETCSSGGGCLEHGYNAGNTITYGSIPGNGNPVVGDAYDCDVNNDGVYSPTTERFYFVRKTTGDVDKAILVHYTSFDKNGQMDSSASRGNYSYDLGKTYLPSSTFPSQAAWSNPALTNFNGKTSRYINHDDLISACGGTVVYNDVSYLSTCQFFLENSRYQSGMLGRLGIWVDKENDTLYRINTQTAVVENPDNNANTVRPVIEISTGKLEKYQAGAIYIIHFDTHGGTSVSSIYKYNGETLGNIVTTKEHFDFVGWYANYNDEEYTNLVTSSTVIRGNMTLHAKWTPKEIHTVTFNANGGTINGESTYELEVENGSTVNDEDFPEAIYGEKTLIGWYINGEQLYPFTSATVVRDDIEVFANWDSADYVAQIGIVKYETLDDAVEAVSANSGKTTITILKDIELSAKVTIPANKWVELDIGEYTISNSSSYAMSGQQNGNSSLLNVNNKGKLDIINGTLYSTNPYIIYNAYGGIVNISGGLLEYNNANVTEFKPIENSGGTVNITGGTLTCNSQAATINNKTSSGVLNVSGGEIRATGTVKGQAIYMDGGAKTNISGDVYIENVSNATTNARAAVDNTNGTLTITGGTIVSKQYNAVATRHGAQGSNSTTIIGINDGDTSNTAPVIRGKICGLSAEAGSTTVYDGIFESPAQDKTICTANGISVAAPTVFVDGTEHPVIEGTTYYTRYLKLPEYTVTFYPENGEDPYEITVTKGDKLGNNIPEDPSKTNYYFGGWYDGNTLVTSDTTISGVTDIYAKWLRSLDNGTIITNPSPFNVEVDGTGQISFEEDDIEPVSYSSSNNTVATVDEFGVVTGHTIDSTTITLTGQKSGLTRTITVNVTEIKHTVTFLDSDHETVIDTVEVGDEEALNNLLPIPTNSNYIFNGWFIEDDSTRPFTSETIVRGDLTVVANWTPNIRLATLPEEFAVAKDRVKQLVITGPDGMESYTVTSGNNNLATITQNGSDITVTGVAIGTTTINITGSRSNIVIQIPLEVTEVIMHTVTFRDYDNTFITSMQIEHETTLANNELSLPTLAPRQDHIFDGWFINNVNLTPFTISTPVSGDLTVVARWKEELNIATVTTNPDPFEFKVGKTGQIIVTPTGDGTVESHHFSSSDGNIATVNEDTGEVVGVSLGTVIITITGNDTGQIRQVEVTINNLNNITFDPDNDDPLEIIKVADGNTIGENVPSNPTKDGYIFEGWYLYDEINEMLTTILLDPNEVINTDKTYKPKWVSNIYFTAIDKSTGTEYYTSIKEAIDHVEKNLADETEIRIIQNITNTSGQTIIDQNKKIRINGGNYSVSCGSGTTNQLMIVSSGSLRIISGTFTCNKDGLAVLQNENKGKLYIDGGTISNTNNRGAIYNNGGAVTITGGTLTSTATIRPVVQNAKSGASILMTGGTVIQLTTNNVTTDGLGAIKVIASTSATIRGGTVISNSPNSAGVYATGANAVLTIGTQNNVYDATNPVIQGAKYGVMSTVTYSIFDGIIKGVTAAVDVEGNINTTSGIEPGAIKVNDMDGNYKTLYYRIPKYHIDFEANEGEVEDSFLEFSLNTTITEDDLPTPVRTDYTFDGWYTDEELTEPFEEFTPTEEATVTYYAKWTANT